MQETTPFRSFWMGGYECADQVNKYGDRVDLLNVTGHIAHLEKDYALLSVFGIRTVREGICWSRVERTPYQYNWEQVRYMMRTAGKQGIQQIWDICHFGFPDDLTPLHPHFAQRFTALCTAFVACYRELDPHSTIYVTPINEVSFISWLGGDAAGTSPFCVRQGWEVKYHLMRAYIQGIKAMQAADNNLKIITTEPLVHIVPDPEASLEEVMAAAKQRQEQYQALDILYGHICPELGGSPELVDIIGVNFYYSNQWIYGTSYPLPWAEHDRHPEWMPLCDLLEEVYNRYQKPVALTETSHPGEDRPLWISYIAEECTQAIGKGLPLVGICIYPILDRPDWDHPDQWHNSGLWSAADNTRSDGWREIVPPYALAIKKGQEQIYAQQQANTFSAELSAP